MQTRDCEKQLVLECYQYKKGGINSINMKKKVIVQLRNFEKKDALVLSERIYQELTTAQIEDMICLWNTKQHDGKYFEMFAIVASGKVVGRLSLYSYKDKTISIGPEIFPEYRGKCFAKAAMIKAIGIAKENGYSMISQQIRVDNEASIALHTSLGFEMVGIPFVNSKGNNVCMYEKSLR